MNSLCNALAVAQPAAIIPLVKLICRITSVNPPAKVELAVTTAAIKAALERAPPASGGWSALADTPGVGYFAPVVSICVTLLHGQPQPSTIAPLIRLLCRVLESSPPERDVLVLAASAVKAGVSRASPDAIAEHTAAAVTFAALVINLSDSTQSAMALLDQQLQVDVPAVGSAAAGKRKRDCR